MRRCRLLLFAALSSDPRGVAEATSVTSASCAMVEPRRRRTKDGRSFLFDPCSNAWRLEESAAADPSPSPAAEPLALPWSQFNVSFHGDFRIGGIPMLLGDDPERRAKEQQEFADTGSSIWDGAVALAKVLEQQPFLVRGREVLELGAGRGLSGLAAWALGARKVHLTDLPYALEAMDSAVQLTCTGHKDLPKPEVAELDWSKAEEFFENRDTDLDVILAADVVWLMDLVEPLADAIATVAKYHPKVEVLVVHQTRSANVELAFLKAMEARSLGVLWSLPGGPGVELFAEPALRWHEDFVPDQRIKLWCFKLQTEGAKEPDAVAAAC